MLAERVFVAGATGAIGRVLCRLLLADGWTVFGTTRKRERAPALEQDGITPVIVDVFDAAALSGTISAAKPRAVIHQLTDLPQHFDPAALREALPRNARLREVGTQNLVDAAVAAGVSTVVAQSIAFAYAPGAAPFDEEAPLNVDAADPAMRATAQAVQTLERLVLTGPFRGVVLRYGRLYGPGTWASAPPAGNAVHVDAAADAARRAVRGVAAGIFNIAEPGGDVVIEKAIRELGWHPAFRADRD